MNQPDIGWCTCCGRAVVEIPKGTCSECFNHTIPVVSALERDDLERQLAETRFDAEQWEKTASTLLSRAEKAEQRILESQRQEPARHEYLYPDMGGHECIHSRLIPGVEPLSVFPLYRSPIIPPTVEEAVKAEREACADISKNWRRKHVLAECCDHAQHVACTEIEQAIRERGE